jgi:RHS repeat-associated protein
MIKTPFIRAAAFRVSGVLVATVLALAGLTGSARAQSLGVQGDHFTVDGEARFLTFLSYFDAMRATDLAGDLSFIKHQAGFDGIRIFPNWWHYSGSPSGCPSAASDTLFTNTGAIRGDNGDVLAPSGRLLQLILVLRAAQAQGLIVDVSFTRETVANPGELDILEYTAAMGRIAFLLREYRNVMFDIQNERDNGSSAQQLSHREVRDIKNAIKAVDPGRVVMASGGGTAYVPGDLWNHGSATGFTLRSEIDVIAYHDQRGAGWEGRTTQVVQDLRQVNNVSSNPEWSRPVYLQEPTRWRMSHNACGVLETTDQSDPDPAHFRTALQLAKQAGAAAWTFHTQRAFRLPATGPLHQQISQLPAGHLERDLYLGPSRLTATGGAVSWSVTVQLTVQVSGPGTVTGSHAGNPTAINCTSVGGAGCIATLTPGTDVTFTTSPQAAARFEGYDMLSADATEPCGGTAACTIRILAPTQLGARFGVAPAERIEYQHTDGISSIRAVTNEAGVRIATYDFRPFGEEYPYASGDTLTTRRLFAGKERDAESGLDYFGARYYASRAGRFTTVDPVLDLEAAITDPQRWNRYPYARNNPLRYTDPDGRIIETVWDIANIGIGIASAVDNFRKGNVGSGLLDVGGVIVDGAATLVPGIPGGAGAAIKAARAAEKVADAAPAVIKVSRSKYGEAAEHIAEAQAAGFPSVLTVGKKGAKANREASLDGIPNIPGKHRDEYPPAMFKEGGSGSSVKIIKPRDNMACGAHIGNQCRALKDGAKVRIEVVD